MKLSPLVLSFLTATTAAALSTTSRAGQALLSQARRLDNGEDGDYDFVGDYSIKFQGCHHVQQWNSNADEDGDEDQVRIMTKRLVRFRLCPMDSCNSEKSTGCSSKYGDYIVDMNTFVSYYMEGMADEKDRVCEDVDEYCEADCQNSEDGDCLYTCYEEYDASFCLEEDLAETYGFDTEEYLECAKTDFGGRRKLAERKLNDEVEYYIGPFCAAQGGEIHLGVFTDETCTTRADNGDSTFASAAGYSLPFSDDSLIPTRCLKCGYKNGDGEYATNEACSGIYQMSGKCETRMNVDYPNESSCDYIEGIKIIREDGVIRTSSVRKSKSAAVAIGVFITVSVLLAGYVFYLRTKLSRAQINLAASTAPLT
eukprot:CAMPEP_0172465108 /NCGR_PEP_ID=MMETSP1065-20121228/52478_1 /TAXON_ID=265537 /ORGANISM="Amphiprora paludosa, Strain CCMP125" /LENGTH=367 /DNA_ID=CAMNT_0013221537 /DNA_START=44 /DNA_END=1147 /DNA_ORIENTATION=+